MSVRMIHAACEQLIGRPVVYGTVRDWLSDNVTTNKVTRVKHGVYRLASPSQYPPPRLARNPSKLNLAGQLSKLQAPS